jgi:hypothetical protein
VGPSTSGLRRKINPCADDLTADESDALAMSTLDYILGVSALGLILWNMRRHELTDRRLRRPVIIAAAVCFTFLRGLPTAGADGALVALGIVIGVSCGTLSALATRVERDETTGAILSAATPLAIGITAAAFLGRMAFAVAATNGLGPAIARFSSRINVHSAQAWVAALVLMAAADLVVRSVILRRRRDAISAGRTWTLTLGSA